MSSFQIQEDIRMIELAKDPACKNRKAIMKKICDSCSQNRSDYLMARVLCELPFTDYDEFVLPICEMLQNISLQKRDYAKVRRIFEHWTEVLPDSSGMIKKTMACLKVKYPDFRTENEWK